MFEYSKLILMLFHIFNNTVQNKIFHLFVGHNSLLTIFFTICNFGILETILKVNDFKDIGHLLFYNPTSLNPDLKYL